MLGLTKLWRRRCGRSNGDATRNRAAILGAFICAALTSCAVGPDYLPPAPPLPAHFAATSSSLNAPSDRPVGRPLETTQWWRLLHDRELNSLVERALAASPTLEIALDRLQQARAQELVVIGAALPSAEWTAGGGWGTGSDLARGRASQTLISAETGAGVAQVVNLAGFDAGLGARYFRQVPARRSRRRNTMSRPQSPPAMSCWYRSLPMSFALISICVRSRWSLRSYARTFEVAHKYVDFVQERFSRGITNELDVTLAQRELAQLQAQVAPLAARIDAARYVIAVLIGEFPENLGNELKRPGILPVLPVRIRAGLPIDLLRRRPDIVEAERQLASATAQIGVATATLFPQVAVTAAAGRQTGVSPFLISPIWSVGPAFAVPILDFGRLDAAVERADYRGRELLFAYKQTVLNAVREVDTAIDAYAAQQNRLRHLVEALTAAARGP